jgi:ubiquinol-cytochrome c reductase cytochrome b subunit
MADLKSRVSTAGREAYQWLEHRLGLIKPLTEAAEHPTPSSSASWLYVFGSAATVLLVMQIMTGILLSLVYSPSGNEAWRSLNVLNHNVPLGWYLRALHGWGSDFMIAIVVLHMAQVFVFGAYKFPRELTWIVGVLLLLLTLGMAFTGQVLRFDQDAYWGLGIGASLVSRVPLIGAPLVHLMLGAPTIGGATLSRFFTLHVFIFPGLLLAGVGVHIWMVLLHGVSEWPMPGRLVSKATYEREYHEITAKTGIPFVPDAAWKRSLRPRSCSPSWPAPSSSARSAPAARPIRPSCKRCPSLTSHSCGFTPSSRYYHLRLKLPLSSSRLSWVLPGCSRCHFFRAKAKDTGQSGPWLC